MEVLVNTLQLYYRDPDTRSFKPLINPEPENKDKKEKYMVHFGGYRDTPTAIFLVRFGRPFSKSYYGRKRGTSVNIKEWNLVK